MSEWNYPAGEERLREMGRKLGIVCGAIFTRAEQRTRAIAETPKERLVRIWQSYRWWLFRSEFLQGTALQNYGFKFLLSFFCSR